MIWMRRKRYAQILHSRYSSLILAMETHSFHSIVDAIRNMEARATIEESLKLKSTKAEQSAIPKATNATRFDHLVRLFPHPDLTKIKEKSWAISKRRINSRIE